MSSLLKRLKNLIKTNSRMANDFYREKWVTFLKCKQCNIFKELNDDNRYKHNEGFLWVLWRCKECIKAGRKTEYELKMARKRDAKRYKENPQRREYIYKSAKERNKRHEENWEWRNKLHLRTSRRIAKLWIRPQKCPICWYEWRIVAHHPSLNNWREIVFCCQICHGKIHKGDITDYTVVNLLD